MMRISSAGQPSDRQGDLWAWCLNNGLLASQLLEPFWVDTDLRTITVRHLVAKPEPGEASVPKFERGPDTTQPLIEWRTVALITEPPAWTQTVPLQMWNHEPSS